MLSRLGGNLDNRNIINARNRERKETELVNPALGRTEAGCTEPRPLTHLEP